MLPFWAQAVLLGLRRQTPARAILGASPGSSLVANLVANLVAEPGPNLGPNLAKTTTTPWPRPGKKPTGEYGCGQRELWALPLLWLFVVVVVVDPLCVVCYALVYVAADRVCLMLMR